MKNVKIVFSDLDSTLTKSAGVIDDEYKEIFKRLKEKKITVVINTGRPLSYIIPICKEFNTSNYIIASNGAEIYDFKNNIMINHSSFSENSVNVLNYLITKYNLYFMVNSGLTRYTNKKENNEGFVVVETLNNIPDISQVILESYSYEDMENLKKDIENLDDLIIANRTKHITKGKLLYFDIVNKDVSKGIAMDILCKHLNISIADTMGIGDSGNDVEMLKKAHYKVAVSNATEDLMKIANIITLSNKENGPAIVLNDLYDSL